MTADSSYSLESLERRWQLEKTPQVGLRLAEEYRRKGDLSASVEALATGLEVYPTHTASRVALSRYLVDAERFEDAVPHLEQIVARDPAHLVANKLLVGAYVGVGRLGDARDKLDIYEMMGEGDADIERLHELLEGAERSEATPVVEPLAAEAPEAFEPPLDPDGQAVTEAVFDEPLAEVPAEPAESSAPRVVADGEAASPEPFAQELAEEPFGSLAAGRGEDYWQEVADEGIFALDPGVSSQSYQWVAPRPSEAATVPATELESGPAGTATLGELYLEQGHRQEAVEVFEQVLERDPDNETARHGLEIAATPETPALEATGAESGLSPVALLERKKLVLTTYLAQLRRAVAAGV